MADDADAAVDVVRCLGRSRAAPLLFGSSPWLPRLTAALEAMADCDLPGVGHALAAAGTPLASFLPTWWHQLFVGVVPWPQVQRSAAKLLRDGPAALVLVAFAILKHLAPALLAAASAGSSVRPPLVAEAFVLEEHAAFLASAAAAHGPAIANAIEAELAQLWLEGSDDTAGTTEEAQAFSATTATPEAEWV
jgi:hypothetical protein